MTGNGRDRRALYQRCRGIDTARVARDAGLEVRKRAGRQWCRCPFHGERTPSLMMDARGRWYCFGCGRSGDAVAFYALWHRVGMHAAALALRAQYLYGEGGR